MARYKVTKQQLEMVVESFVMENSNRASRRKVQKMNEDQLNEFLGLGKKIRSLVSDAKKAANIALGKLSDEQKSEIVSTLMADEKVGVKGIEEIGEFGASLKNINITPKEEAELASVQESLNEARNGKITRIVARILAIIGFPLTSIAGVIGMFVSGYNTGWSQVSWGEPLRTAIKSVFGDMGGPMGMVVFVLGFVWLVIGVANWNKGKEKGLKP